MSHIYLIITLDNPARVKVGRTDRDPLERLQELQTGASSPLRLIAAYQVRDACLTKRVLHHWFSARKLSDAWFWLTAAVASSILARFQRYNL
jgi:Meiotically up-regulated gene 113